MGFELIGYDFMIDQDLKVYLIEINRNPCLSTFTVKQRRLIEKLIEDTIRYAKQSLLVIFDKNFEF